MPVFVYRAADRRGQTIDGVMEADDVRAVVERLHKEAYYPIRVTPHAERRTWAWTQLSSGRGLRQRDLLTMTQQLATLFEAGVPLDRALGILAELAPNPRIKTIITDLLRSVRSGASLSEALAKHHPRPFSRLYINMVRAGEKGGVLEVALRRLAEFLESRAAFAEAVVTALIYPAFVTVVAAGAVVFLMTFVLPRFAAIFADLKQTIPLPTQIVLAVSTAIREYWWVGAFLVAGGVLAWRVWTGTPEGRLAWDRTRLRLPRLGPLAVKIETARFARTLGTMLQSGVPMTGALAIVGEMMSNQVMARAVTRISDSVKRGITVAAAMAEHAVFPPLAVHMVRVGEETGRLEEMLLKTAETFETDVRTELKRAVSLIEIGVILVMGALVAFIVVAMLLAIFSINEVPL
jgi:general secretion pathway protein F